MIPTRARTDYLEVALASIAPQAAAAAAELIVVDDAGASEPLRHLAERFGARYEPHPRPLGLNVARNTGVERSHGELVVFVDDDVEVCDGWLQALLRAASEHPDTDVFTGPIRPRLEGSPPRSCGREAAPITALELGSEDVATRFAWGANMTIRRSALERVGPFEVSLEQGGDEQEWQERLDGDAGALYVAGAGLAHRRSPADARLLALCRAARARGRASRRFDAWRGDAPRARRELSTLAACIGHVARYRCPAGLTMVAHSFGRLQEALRRPTVASAHRSQAGTPPAEHTPPPEHTPPAEDFLSGESGTVGGLDGIGRVALDLGEDVLRTLSGEQRRLARAARERPARRRVLILGVERPEHGALVARARQELLRSRHRVELRTRTPDDRGKFENLNRLLAEHDPPEHDWLLVIDDDIGLPKGFLDRFLFLAEHFELDLCQPAQRRASHAAWRVTRRTPRSVARETRFVEIGPVTAFARRTFSTLLPFPDLRMGWGLDLHWAALAREHGWRCGVLDAVAISHRAAPAGDAYSREQALTEARCFLERRPYLSAREAQSTLRTHRGW